MEIKKGQKLKVRHSRKGIFNGIALKDFDATKDEFYPIVLDQDNPIIGEHGVKGEVMPCRKGICRIELR